jgi:hypothetical protein
MTILTTTALTIACATSTSIGGSINLEFAGGSLAEWVDAIKSASPTSSIVLIGSGDDVKMPAMSLHDVAVATCVRVADAVRYVEVSEINESGEGQSVWLIQHAPATGRRDAPSRPHSTAIFPLPPSYFDADKAAMLVDVVTELCMIGNQSKPVVLIRRDFGLLAMFGSPSQLGIASEVLSEVAHHTISNDESSEHTATPTRSSSEQMDRLLHRMNRASEARAAATTLSEQEAAKQEWHMAFNALRDYRNTHGTLD